MNKSLFHVITEEDWAQVFADHRASLWPDELPGNEIIEHGDLFYTPLLKHIDGRDWRPVPPDLIGLRVGARRIRRS